MKTRIVLENIDEVVYAFCKDRGDKSSQTIPYMGQHGYLVFEDGLADAIHGYTQGVDITPPISRTTLFDAMAPRLNIKIKDKKK